MSRINSSLCAMLFSTSKSLLLTRCSYSLRLNIFSLNIEELGSNCCLKPSSVYNLLANMSFKYWFIGVLKLPLPSKDFKSPRASALLLCSAYKFWYSSYLILLNTLSLRSTPLIVSANFGNKVLLAIGASVSVAEFTASAISSGNHLRPSIRFLPNNTELILPNVFIKPALIAASFFCNFAVSFLCT